LALAEDVAGFIEQHELQDTTLIGHSMGAKTAMTLALRSPELVSKLISVDNAPWDSALQSDFGKYIEGMRKVEAAGITKQAEGDKILEAYEGVGDYKLSI
jgi:pimeloyl-ACP methyl ester carboxylesterase